MNDAAVRVSVLYLHIPQVKNSSQNLEQPHLIGLINTCRGKTHRLWLLMSFVPNILCPSLTYINILKPSPNSKSLIHPQWHNSVQSRELSLRHIRLLCYNVYNQTDLNVYLFICEDMHVTEQCEGIASGAELLGVVHAVDNGAAALPGVQEVIGTAWVERRRGWRDSENMQHVQFHNVSTTVLSLLYHAQLQWRNKHVFNPRYGTKRKILVSDSLRGAVG